MAGGAADGKHNLRTASFTYYNKPSVVSSNLSNPNSSLADHRRVNSSLSYPTSVRAPTRGVFGSDNYLKNIECPIPRHRSASCRSHTALNPILHRNGSQAKQKKGINGRKLMSSLGHCFHNKGVHINRQQPPRSSLQRIEVQMDLEESRRFIEVFGSGAVAMNMARKLSMLTWDAIPKPQTSTSGNGHDVASDASSDLFEIQNISGPPMAAAGDDDASSFCTTPAPSRYSPSPSEASIQWSVVTADCSAAAGIKNSKGCKEERKGQRRHGGILGCRSQKAVGVVASTNQDKGKLLPALR